MQSDFIWPINFLAPTSSFLICSTGWANEHCPPFILQFFALQQHSVWCTILEECCALQLRFLSFISIKCECVCVPVSDYIALGNFIKRQTMIAIHYTHLAVRNRRFFSVHFCAVSILYLAKLQRFDNGILLTARAAAGRQCAMGSVFGSQFNCNCKSPYIPHRNGPKCLCVREGERKAQLFLWIKYS